MLAKDSIQGKMAIVNTRCGCGYSCGSGCEPKVQKIMDLKVV